MNNRNLDYYGDVLTVKEVYDILPLGMNKVRKLISDGVIRSIRVDNRIIIPKKAVQEFLGIKT